MAVVVAGLPGPGWACFQRIAEPIFSAFQGKLIKGAAGPAFVVAFAAPTQAVLAAMALQDGLWAHNQKSTEADRLSARIAASAGEVRLSKGDVSGDAVNLAARLEAITPPGEIYLHESVYAAMNKAEVPAEELGSLELSGAPGAVKVYRVPNGPFQIRSTAPNPGANEPPFGGLALPRLEPGRRTWRLPERWIRPAAFAGLALVAVTALFLTFHRNTLDSALSAVASAPIPEREARAQEARLLIAQLKTPGDRDDADARLEEALGHAWVAVRGFEEAVEEGSSAAQAHLIELLSHPDCRVRAAAATALGDLHVDRARSRLERLKQEGGPNEGPDIPIIGCNSKTAAAQALSQLP
jgi:hypothetical protein